MLTASADTFTGAAGNDTFNANVVAGTSGVADVETLTALDVLAGGEGADVLNYTTVGGTALPAATISGIETINVVSDGAATADVSGANITGVTTLTAKATGAAVNIDTKANVTSVTVTGTATTVDIDDAGTAATSADKITTVSVTGNTGALAIGAANAVDSLTTLSLAKTNQNATVTATAGTRALTVNLNEVAGGTIQDNTATTLTVNASGVKSSGVTLNAAAATAVTIAADETLGVTDVNIAAAKTLTVTGDSLVTIAATSTVTALESVVSTGSTGGVAITAALGTGVAVTGGAGKDSVSLQASHAKAVTMGAGDDTVTMAGAVTTGGSVDAGEGTDTLSMTAAVAESVSAGTTFEAGISNFEKVKIGAALGGQTDTIDMANLDDINYVISAGGTAAVADVPEVQTITLGTLVNSQAYTLTVNGTAYTTAASDADTTAAELLALIQGHAGYAAAPFTAALNAGSTALVITFKANQGAITPLSTLAATGYTTATAVETTAGVTAVAGGTLVINNLASAGTFELTGAITAASTVAVKDAASGTSDVLNIKLNGANQLVNTAALTVANVETINIQATDSAADTTTLDNPSAASTILLNAAAATKIVVTGNHGVDFTGSTLTKVVELDASGVVSVGDAAGATAATIATVGAVTFSSVVDNKAVTVTTGNGADVINVSSINGVSADSIAFLATGVTASTITTGEGNDQITGSTGKDVINAGAGNDIITGGAEADQLTGGAGNDKFVFAAATDSTLAKMDVITGFSANTYGQGTAGAADVNGATTDTTKWTGDVLDFDSITTMTKIAVGIYTNAADATVFLQNNGTNTADTLGAALDSTTGNLYIDLNSDGTVDSVIQLAGVTTLTTAAFADLT